MRKAPRHLAIFGALIASTWLMAGCPDDDDDDPTDTTSTTDTSTTSDTDAATTTDTTTADGDTTPTIPTPPALGTQIDRIGRPGVSTALVGTFESNDTTKGDLKDDYNEAAPSTWASFAAGISANLALYDGLDTVCGNQLVAGATAEEGRYDTLGGLLADDRIWVNTASTTCTTYLAVEADTAGIVANDDCGGRKFGYDVIDVTYSALAIGQLSGVGDGIAADDGTTTDTFPFLDAPGRAFPEPPALSAMQIDRIGRPGVSTALIATFEADDTAKGDLKDDYNQALPAAWGDFAAAIAGNLALYDGLDTTCGNQLLAGATVEAGRYNTLAGALADDRIWVNTASATCTTYLAVEANVTGILTNTDCGGRRLGYDVIDITYSALAAGAFSGVGDGIAMDDGTPTATFPFLDAPPAAQ